MGCAPGFTDQPSVLDGASDIVNEVFGPRGLHTRMVYSNNEMPMDCATLVVLFAEVASQRDGTTRSARRSGHNRESQLTVIVGAPL